MTILRYMSTFVAIGLIGNGIRLSLDDDRSDTEAVLHIFVGLALLVAMIIDVRLGMR